MAAMMLSSLALLVLMSVLKLPRDTRFTIASTVSSSAPSLLDRPKPNLARAKAKAVAMIREITKSH